MIWAETETIELHETNSLNIHQLQMISTLLVQSQIHSCMYIDKILFIIASKYEN